MRTPLFRDQGGPPTQHAVIPSEGGECSLGTSRYVRCFCVPCKFLSANVRRRAGLAAHCHTALRHPALLRGQGDRRAAASRAHAMPLARAPVLLRVVDGPADAPDGGDGATGDAAYTLLRTTRTLLLITHRSPLTTHHSPLTTHHHPPLTTHHSLITACPGRRVCRPGLPDRPQLLALVPPPAGRRQGPAVKRGAREASQGARLPRGCSAGRRCGAGGWIATQAGRQRQPGAAACARASGAVPAAAQGGAVAKAHGAPHDRTCHAPWCAGGSNPDQ